MKENWFCAKCGSPMNEWANFCQTCGEHVSKDNGEPVEQVVSYEASTVAKQEINKRAIVNDICFHVIGSFIGASALAFLILWGITHMIGGFGVDISVSDIPGYLNLIFGSGFAFTFLSSIPEAIVMIMRIKDPKDTKYNVGSTQDEETDKTFKKKYDRFESIASSIIAVVMVVSFISGIWENIKLEIERQTGEETTDLSFSEFMERGEDRSKDSTIQATVPTENMPSVDTVVEDITSAQSLEILEKYVASKSEWDNLCQYVYLGETYTHEIDNYHVYALEINGFQVESCFLVNTKTGELVCEDFITHEIIPVEDWYNGPKFRYEFIPSTFQSSIEDGLVDVSEGQDFLNEFLSARQLYDNPIVEFIGTERYGNNLANDFNVLESGRSVGPTFLVIEETGEIKVNSGQYGETLIDSIDNWYGTIITEWALRDLRETLADPAVVDEIINQLFG